MVSFDFSIQAPEGFAGGAVGFTGVFVVLFYLICVVYSITTYALQAIGMYRIAKRRGIHHSWLAWVPVGDMWLLGSISDQYQYVVKGRVRNRRRILLRLTVVITLISLFAGMCAAVASVSKILHITGSDVLIGAAFAIAVLAYVALVVLGIILAVFAYIALCDLYCSCDRRAAVALLILSVVVSPAIPFVVFALREKDQGMVPRTVEDTQAAQQELPRITEQEEVPVEQSDETPVEETPGDQIPAQPQSQATDE